MTQRRNFVGRTNHGFACEQCGAQVLPMQGGFRNHCPVCLWSKHVDIVPGDRASDCGGLMQPVALESDAKRGWMLAHRCVRCGFTRRNRVAAGARQPDDFAVMLGLMERGG